MHTDHFSDKADTYEQNQNRINNVDNIAKSILANIQLNESMHLLDFGSGTGLLLERIAPFVRKITAVDVSSSMISQLEKKRGNLPCELEIIEKDLEKSEISGQYNGIISSMTMHHIQNVESIFSRFFDLAKPGGFIAIADLDKEAGDFHTEEAGVHHFGFEHGYIRSVAERVGFRNIEVSSASVIKKPNGDFPVFLLTADR